MAARAARSKKLSASGVIEKMARNGKAFVLDDDDQTWYSVFKLSQMGDAQVGDTVSFDYEDKKQGNQTFHNVQGNVTIDEAGEEQEEEEEEERPARGRKPAAKAARASASKASEAVDSKDRRISRLSMLGSASRIVAQMEVEGAENAAEAAVTIARAFEEYVYEE